MKWPEKIRPIAEMLAESKNTCGSCRCPILECETYCPECYEYCVDWEED